MTASRHPLRCQRPGTLPALLLAALLASACATPVPGDGPPDAEALGRSLGYPVGTNLGNWYSDPRHRVGSWSALDRVPGMRVDRVAAAATASPLPRAAGPTPAISYRYRNLSYTLDDYLNRQRITGLLILKDGQIVAEHYRYARTDEARFLSFSMAKSVTALLVGMALERGVLASLDDPAETYAKELAGSAYGGTSIRHLLRMSSGLTFTERYDGNDDIARFSRAQSGAPPDTPTGVLRGIRDRHSAAGAKFAYASAETAVLGRVLEGASGRSVAALTQEWLWQPMGAEHSAFWRLDSEGRAMVHGFFNASLRDWGRLGWLLARDGKASTPGEPQLISREFVLDATDPARQPAALRPRTATPYLGYGYQFWLLPMRSRTFALQGIHGQTVYVQPASGIVMVQTSAYTQASGRQDPQPYEERDALWRGVLRSLGGSTDD
jgi:CubicO group peptidase (beta-lactamase class C family)